MGGEELASLTIREALLRSFCADQPPAALAAVKADRILTGCTPAYRVGGLLAKLAIPPFKTLTSSPRSRITKAAAALRRPVSQQRM